MQRLTLPVHLRVHHRSICPENNPSKCGHEKGQRSDAKNLEREASLEHVLHLNVASGEADNVGGGAGGEQEGELSTDGCRDHEEEGVDVHGLSYLDEQGNQQCGGGIVGGELGYDGGY